MQTTPRELSVRLIELHNLRDLDGMMELMAERVEFVRPGPAVMATKDEVRAQYEHDWTVFARSHVEVRQLLQLDACVAAEITIRLRAGNDERAVEGAVFHEWADGKLAHYRAYFDIPPP